MRPHGLYHVAGASVQFKQDLVPVDSTAELEGCGERKLELVLNIQRDRRGTHSTMGVGNGAPVSKTAWMLARTALPYWSTTSGIA